MVESKICSHYLAVLDAITMWITLCVLSEMILKILDIFLCIMSISRTESIMIIDQISAKSNLHSAVFPIHSCTNIKCIRTYMKNNVGFRLGTDDHFKESLLESGSSHFVFWTRDILGKKKKKNILCTDTSGTSDFQMCSPYSSSHCG